MASDLHSSSDSDLEDLMLAKKKILVIDDEQDILEFLSYNLKREGAKGVYSYQWSKAAIELAKSKRPDLILLDVMMPEMDGMETCMQLRENMETKDVVIAFLTATKRGLFANSRVRCGSR